MQPLLVLGCCMLLVTIVFTIAIIGDENDKKQTATTTNNIPEWLESYRLNICSSLSHTGVVTEVDQTFQKIQKLLEIWDDLYGDNPDLMSDQKDIRNLFEVTIKSIEYSCLEFKKGRIEKTELIKELDGQIARLNNLLHSLASLAKARASFQ